MMAELDLGGRTYRVLRCHQRGARDPRNPNAGLLVLEDEDGATWAVRIACDGSVDPGALEPLRDYLARCRPRPAA